MEIKDTDDGVGWLLSENEGRKTWACSEIIQILDITGGNEVVVTSLRSNMRVSKLYPQICIHLLQ